jgi:chromosome segregation ATPase
MSTCQEVIAESNASLEVRKAEFTEMKRQLQEITDQEAKLKADLDEAGKNKQKKKELCEKMKHNIKANRDKFKK